MFHDGLKFNLGVPKHGNEGIKRVENVYFYRRDENVLSLLMLTHAHSHTQWEFRSTLNLSHHQHCTQPTLSFPLSVAGLVASLLPRHPHPEPLQKGSSGSRSDVRWASYPVSSNYAKSRPQISLPVGWRERESGGVVKGTEGGRKENQWSWRSGKENKMR